MDEEQKRKVLSIFKKRDPSNYKECPEKNCPMFDVQDVGSNSAMYFCTKHNFNGIIAV